MNQFMENSPNRDFFELLLKYQNSNAAETAKSKIKSNPECAGHIMLKSWLLAGKYADVKELGSMKLNYNGEYAEEIAELGRLIDVYMSELKQYDAAKPLAILIGGMMTEAAAFLDKSTAAYSDPNEIPSEIWQKAAVIRDWALYMATYFEDRKDFQNEVQLRYIRCKITNAVMSQHMHLVGPDMIGTAKSLEKIKLDQRAIQFYRAVIEDFHSIPVKWSGKKLGIEQKLATWSLLEAYKAALRLGFMNDRNVLSENIKTLEKMLEE